MPKMVIYLIRIQACRIDYPSCPDLFAIARDKRDTLCLLDGSHSKVQFELCPIHHCLCRARKWNSKGTENPLPRDKHPSQCAFSQMRLTPIHFFLVDEIDICIPIFMCLLQKIGQRLELFLRPCNQEAAHALEWTSYLYHEFFHERIAAFQ